MWLTRVIWLLVDTIGVQIKTLSNFFFMKCLLVLMYFIRSRWIGLFAILIIDLLTMNLSLKKFQTYQLTKFLTLF